MDTQKKKLTETTSPKKIDYKRWGKTVRLSTEVYDHIIKNGQFNESFDDVVRRLLLIAKN